jgi:hypothetical protein
MIPFLSGIWSKILLVGGILVGVLLFLAKVRQSGKDAVRAEQLRKNAEARKVADETEHGVDSAGPDELERLRRKWER